MKLDKTDRRILSLLSENPCLCQEDLAKSLGITQPAICLRMKKLKKQGLIEESCGLKVNQSGLKLSVSRGKGNLEQLKDNPYFIAGFQLNDEVVAVFAGENEGTARSVPKAMIKNAKVDLVDRFNGKISLEFRETGKPAMKCDKCKFYGDCLGMPGTEWYNGSLWEKGV
ncbi:MAG: Lrp/AsnC family transcriptional regulator [Candidatus Altiarchaeota archaeon]|nr:Lrp/AsnC family transcriptional regulator [Candidatus Altiarchaeota archaeon]